MTQDDHINRAVALLEQASTILKGNGTDKVYMARVDIEKAIAYLPPIFPQVLANDVQMMLSFLNADRADVLGKTKEREASRSRNALICALHLVRGHKTNAIAKELKIHHTTVLWALNKHSEHMQEEDYRQQFEKIQSSF